MALTVLIVLPLVGAAGVLILRARGQFEPARRMGLGVSLWTLLATLALWVSRDWTAPGVQVVERTPWVEAFGAFYHVGVDGSGLAFITLVSWLSTLAQAASWRLGRRAPAGLAAGLLVLESAAIASIAARDLLLFFVSTEVMLLSAFTLIGVWGRDRRVAAATRFLLIQWTGSSLMLVAIVWIAWRHQIATGVWSFAIDDLTSLDLPAGVQQWIWLALVCTWIVRVPVFPAHTWLPHALSQAPMPAAVLIGGVVVPVACHGLLRMVVPLAPDAATAFAFWLAIAAAVGGLYAAAVALVQPDLRRMAAYMLLSHASVVVIGASAMTTPGRDGAQVQLLASGLWAGAWLLLAGMLVERRQTTQIAEFGGLRHRTPWLSLMVVAVAAAAMALPGTIGFVGVSRSLESALASPSLPHARVMAGLALASAAVWVVGMAWVTQRVIGGAVIHDRNRGLRDMTRGEWWVIAPLVLAAVVAGIWPDALLAVMAPDAAGALPGAAAPAAGLVP